jgi:hypothetical protein
MPTSSRIMMPNSIITVEAKANQVLDCEQNNIELAPATVATTELKELCLNVLPSLADPAMPSTFSTIKAAEDTTTL